MMARLLVVVALLASVTPCATVLAQVRREGEWPSDAERVTLVLEGVSRAQAVRLLADKVGWSVVAHGIGEDAVDVRVRNQPAARVLELILAGSARPFVAQRDGNMIAIAPQTDTGPLGPGMPRTVHIPPPPPIPPIPPTPPIPADAPRAIEHGPKQRGKDRMVAANDMTIAADEIIGNLTVVAGNVDVYGAITEDLTVFAGNVVLHNGAHVYGNVSSVAGNVEIKDGARVDGRVSGVATNVDRGDVGRDDEQEDEAASADDDGDVALDLAADGVDGEDDDTSIWARLERAGNAVARSALLFAFGAVLLALASTRMRRLEGEIAVRPLRSFAMGAVGLFAGVFVVLAMAVTIVGIPLALAALLVGAVAVYVGMCAALTALGRALLGHRNPSAYLHLGIGCALYLVASSLPGIGWLVTWTVVLIGCGALVSTRGADLLVRRSRQVIVHVPERGEAPGGTRGS